MKIETLVAPAMLVCVSGTTLAAFDVRSVDCASLGRGVTATADFYQSNAPGAGNRPPTAEAIEASGPDNYLQFDSYVAIDVGPTCGGRPAMSSNSVVPSE